MLIFKEIINAILYHFGGKKPVSELFDYGVLLENIFLFFKVVTKLPTLIAEIRECFFVDMTLNFLVFGSAHACARNDFVENLLYHSLHIGECCLKSQKVANNGNTKNDHKKMIYLLTFLLRFPKVCP